jgi:hypothetical protein
VRSGLGVNWLPPVGLMFFSVGEAGGGRQQISDVVGVVVVVVVVLEGALVPPPPQAAVNPPIAMIAAAPAIAGRRRANRPDLMMESYLSRDHCARHAIRAAHAVSHPGPPPQNVP